MPTITRSYRIRSYPNGAQRRLRDRWFGAYRWLWNTALEIRTEAYRECGLGLRQLAARDDACPEEILVQVLAEGDGVQFTRSGQYNRACLEQERLH